MNTLIRHIEYLLSRTDCVIIPDFGAILATHVGSQYDSEGQVFMPPKRVFTFNAALRHNDGALAASIQRGEGLNQDAAMTIVHNAVNALKACLAEDGRVTLGIVGDIISENNGTTLYLDTKGQSQISVDTFWLMPIEVSELESQKGIVVEPPIIRDSESHFRKIIRGAASVAAILAIGFIASTPLPVDDAMLASLAPEISQVSAEDIIPAKEELGVLTIIAPKEKDERLVMSKDVVPESVATKYYVVVATFATQAEAEKFISYNPQTTLNILNKGKYFNVYISSYSDKAEAYAALKSVYDAYPDAWVYNK